MWQAVACADEELGVFWIWMASFVDDVVCVVPCVYLCVACAPRAAMDKGVIRNYADAFRAFDKDGSGRISRREFLNGLDDLRVSVSPWWLSRCHKVPYQCRQVIAVCALCCGPDSCVFRG